MSIVTLFLVVSTSLLLLSSFAIKTRRAIVMAMALSLPFYSTGLTMPDNEPWIELGISLFLIRIFWLYTYKRHGETKTLWAPLVLTGLEVTILSVTFFQLMSAQLTARWYDGILLWLYFAQIFTAYFYFLPLIWARHRDQVLLGFSMIKEKLHLHRKQK